MAHWDDDEMGIGLPFNRFTGIIDGLYATINPIEPNEKKAEIESRLKEQDRTDLKIEYDQNYYTVLHTK